jgi:hypothetical protein
MIPVRKQRVINVLEKAAITTLIGSSHRKQQKLIGNGKAKTG